MPPRPRVLAPLGVALAVALALPGLHAGPLAAAPAPSADTRATSRVLFDADVGSRGLGAYSGVIRGERIRVVDDPVLGSGRKVMRFTVYDSDTGPTPNPRAQVETPRQFGAGDEVYIGWCTLFPTGFPSSLPAGGRTWMTFAEVYGPPYAGAAPVKIGMRSGSAALSWQRNASYGWDVPWERGPIARNVWHDFVLRQKLSRSGSVGFVELWLNTGAGYRRQKLAGRDRLYTQTLDRANGGGANYHKLALYRARGMQEVVTLYHGEHKVGTSFQAVAPRSHGAR